MSPITELIGGVKAYGWGLSAGAGPASFESIDKWDNNNATNVQTVSFTIPQTYTHLQLRCQVAQNAGQGILLRMNNDTGNNYSDYWLGANVTSGYKSENNSFINPFPQSVPDNANNPNEYAMAVIDILDYKATDKVKVVRTRQSQMRTTGGRGVSYGGHVWNSTSAITSLQFIQNNPSFYFVGQSRIDVYGIKVS